MCSGGGGGGSGEQSYKWSEDMAPYWRSLLTGAGAAANQDARTFRQDTGGSRVAGLSTPQWQAGENFVAMNARTGDPTRSLNAAQDATRSTLGDDYLTGSKASPYGRANQFQGMNNPYHAAVTQQGLDQIRENYRIGTEPETTRLFNMSGAFGGSAHQNAIANNQSGLAKALSDHTYKMWNDQYNRSAAMDESYLDRGSGAWNAERGRQMQAIGAGQNENDMAIRRGGAMMSYGDLIRSIDQGGKDEAYGDWFSGRNQHRNNLSWLSGLLGSAQGGMSPAQLQAGPSGGSQALGGAMLLASLFGGK